MKSQFPIDLLGRLDAVVFEADASTLQLGFAAGGALARLGFSADECVADPQFLVKRLHPDDREAALATMRAAAVDGPGKPAQQLEHRMVAASGEERWFRTEVHAVDGEGGATQLVALMIDTTEAHRAADAVRAAETWLRQVVNNAPVVLMALDANGRFLLVEGRGLAALKMTPEQVVGVNLFEAWTGEPDVIGHVKRALAGESFTAYDHVRMLGTWWETRWAPLYDSAGRLTGATGVALDVTDRKHAEEASAQALSLQKATLEAVNDGVLVVDLQGRIVDYNRRFAEMWAVPLEELEARDDAPVLARVTQKVREPDAFLAKVAALYKDFAAVSSDVIELDDGRIFERYSQPQVVDGRAVGRVWSFRDVTSERHATRRATFLAAASKILAGPLENVTPLDVIARLTVPWLCEWCHIFIKHDDGYVETVAAYHHDERMIPLVRRLQPDMRSSECAVARVLTTGQPIVQNGIGDGALAGSPELAAVNPIAQQRLDILRTLRLRGYIAVPLDARGQTIGGITFSTSDERRRFDEADLTLAMDLAQRAALAIDNQRLYQAAKQAVALRDEFLSVASHELRTPVTSLQLAVQGAISLGEDAPAGFLAHALSSAERQTRRLARLVDALLDVSRVQAGRLELVREPTDLGAVARDVVSLLTAEARRADCVVHVETHDGVVGQWDRARLEQVVTNLLSNAIKYGSGAPVDVRVWRENDRARLSVRDRGIGLEPSEASRIFERFERAVSARHYGGLGLGLYIVSRIVEAHGGNVVVDSEPGAGSTFTVELPIG